MTSTPNSPESHEQQIADALAEYLDQQSKEEAGPRPEEFCQRFPHLNPELLQQLRALEQINSLIDDAPSTTGRNHLELPTRLSGYRIVGTIGAGGMGTVYLAEDERLGRRLAIKTLNPRYRDNLHVRARFMLEAQAMARLNHPHIARIYNLGPSEEIPHFVMEYIEGIRLTEVSQKLTFDQQAQILLKVIRAVAFLHQNGILHRDLKPGNILVGSDLEPKVLDFGLARQFDAETAVLTKTEGILGTPAYFSPEQATPSGHLDVRSDVFSLGTILYELLTGQRPFQGDDLSSLLQAIQNQDPVLPRRLNRRVPGPLQNICLKALEKNPADRYRSAADMAADLERFLAGEPVLAAPSSYPRMMVDRVQHHLADLAAWRDDNILSDAEYAAFRNVYDRLFEPEDSWILEMRRFSLAQVSLYFGAWLLVVGSALLLLFPYPGLSGTPLVALFAGVAAPTLLLGLHAWKVGAKRISIAHLLAFCLILPLSLAVAMSEWSIQTQWTRGDPDLELFQYFESFKALTNAQLWWSILLSLPAYWGLRRWNGSPVFTLVLAVSGIPLILLTQLRQGLLDWLESDPGRPFFHLLPYALLYLAAGLVVERLGRPRDSRYLYPIAAALTLMALSGVAAFHEPYAAWLSRNFPLTRGQVEYLFLINALIYLSLLITCERFPIPQLRRFADWFRFVIPGHVLVSLWLLGLSASRLWEETPGDPGLRNEARFFEILLPLAACGFVFGSIPRQLKNFLGAGLLFLAIGLVRLQQDLLRDIVIWPVFLLVFGFIVMWAASQFPRLRFSFRRLLRKRKS